MKTLNPTTALVVLFALGPVDLALGQPADRHFLGEWGGPTSDWGDPTKWTGGSVPGGIDDAYIGSDDGVPDAFARIQEYHAFSSDLYLGQHPGQRGGVAMNLPPGADPDLPYLTTHGNEYIGLYGTGDFYQHGGDHRQTGTPSLSNPQVHLGYHDGAAGTYSLTGGRHFVEDETHDRAGTLFLGVRHGATGTYNLSGSGALSVGGEVVGSQGTGDFRQLGGTNSTGFLTLGDLWGEGDPARPSTGTYDHTGGMLSVETSLTVGGHGNGTFAIDGDGSPTIAIGGELLVGTGAGTGTLQVTGNAALIGFSAHSAVYGENGGWDVFDVSSLFDVHLEGSWTNRTQDETAGDFTQTGFTFSGGGSGTFEVAGLVDAGFDDNFAMTELTVSDGFELNLVDEWDNGNRTDWGVETVFLDAIDIDTTATLDLQGFSVYGRGDVAFTWDAWIADGRIKDDTLGDGEYLDAVYSLSQDWTLLTTVPEPATLVFLVIGTLPLVRRLRRG